MLELGQPVVVFHRVPARRGKRRRRVGARSAAPSGPGDAAGARRARVRSARRARARCREVGKRMQPRRSLLQLAGRLRPAQHQHAEQRDLFVRHADRVVEQVPELGRAAARPARKPRPALFGEPVQRSANRRLVVLDDGIAVGRLVAGEPERVQRQRIGLGRRPLLLDQAPEHAQLDRVGVHGCSLCRMITRCATLSFSGDAPARRSGTATSSRFGAARVIYVSGQVPLDRDGQLIGEGDLAAQARQVFENLQAALDAAGATWADVVKLNYYLVDVSELDHRAGDPRRVRQHGAPAREHARRGEPALPRRRPDRDRRRRNRR